jgi:CRISPR-associated protein Cmr3
MKRITITPLDTFFFKDGKPFSLGQESWANAGFPPAPSVLYGALRSVYFSQHPHTLPDAGSENDPTANLKIRSVSLYAENTQYFPVPADILKNNNEKAILLQPVVTGSSSLSTPYCLQARSADHEKPDSGTLFYSENLSDYLKERKIERLGFTPAITLSEPKVGIGRDNQTHATQAGLLYRVDMQRFKTNSAGLVVEYDGLNLGAAEGLLKLGGEHKAAKYKISEDTQPLPFPTLESRYFKLYLSTPAIFKQGWLPEWIDPNSLKGELAGIKLKLLTAALGKPLNIGGFDMKARQPKPMYKAVPAGSVYYFECLEGTEHLESVFHAKAISDILPEQGFGIAYVARTTAFTNG